MLLRLSIVSASLLLLSACSDPVQDAHKAILESLSGTADIEFIADQSFAHGAVCGQFKQRDKWGESSGTKRYVYRGGVLNSSPNSSDLAIYCTEEPAKVIDQRFGISLATHDSAQIEKLISDLSSLATTLEQYYADHSAYPTSDQGLNALTEQPKESFGLRNYPEGGYLKSIPKDPWQQPYDYQGPVWAGVKSPFTLRSLGADGAEGGSKEARDIGTELIPYLQLLLDLSDH